MAETTPQPQPPIQTPPAKPRSLAIPLLILILIVSGFLVWFLLRRAEENRIANHLTTLEPLVFQPLPLGAIKPEGWLLDQLKLQASGLSGHLDEFWPDVMGSGWIGGKYEGWERAPYWLDGMVPLAYLTGDEKLKKKANRWIDYILNHQLKDGWLGPETSPPPFGSHGESPTPRDPWPQFIILKVLAQYEEATGDPRVIPAMERDVQAISNQMDQNGLSKGQELYAWNFFRWGDLAVTLDWLFDHTGETWLLSMERKVGSQGYNWAKHFDDLPVKERSARWNWLGHVVNNAMGLKTPALLYRLTGESRFKKSTLHELDNLDRYHGEPNGLMSGDECLAGRNPSQGTELCAIVETMFSMENLVSLTGEVKFADRLEKVAFNALPAAITPDFWGHQYDEQSNQVACVFDPQPVYTTNRGDANLFGLEPQFGCCLANFHQGWPKFTSHLWMGTPDGGLTAAAYAPSVVETNIEGNPVKVELITDYPFSENLTFNITVQQPFEFPLYLRVPEWCKDATVKMPDGMVQKLDSGKYNRILRKWSGSEAITLYLPMNFKVTKGYNDSLSIQRGPLVYSLGLKEQWRVFMPFKQQPPGMKKNDYMILPQTHWNYALVLDPDHPDQYLIFGPGTLKGNPFTPEGAPSHVTVQGKSFDWGVDHGALLPPPQSPIETTSPPETLVLVPYGSTKLRVTAFPETKP